MIDILRELIGEPLLGYGFLEYIFVYILALAGLCVIYTCVCAFIDFFR